MNRLGSCLALAGLALAIALFTRSNVGEIADLVVAAGAGLIVASVFHIVPMMVNAVAWRRLFTSSQRPSVRALTWTTWLRESVNGLLPVARIGGELVAYRTVRRQVADNSDAAAALIADMALSVMSQVAFALLALGVLFGLDRTSSPAAELGVASAAMILLGVTFIWVQRTAALTSAMRVLDRIFLGRLRTAVDSAMRIDAALKSIYARKRDVTACLAWQLAGWILGAGEIWLALYFLGRPGSVIDAIGIEAFVQAAASAAFVMPAALGVQEGAFVLIGAALGFDATTSLALATARRLRDVVIFFPGLVAWQWSERHARQTGAFRARELP